MYDESERVKGESQDEKDCLQLIHDFLMNNPKLWNKMHVAW